MKMKIEYYIGEIESMFYQRQFVCYVTALKNNRKITSHINMKRQQLL